MPEFSSLVIKVSSDLERDRVLPLHATVYRHLVVRWYDRHSMIDALDVVTVRADTTLLAVGPDRGVRRILCQTHLSIPGMMVARDRELDASVRRSDDERGGGDCIGPSCIFRRRQELQTLTLDPFGPSDRLLDTPDTVCPNTVKPERAIVMRKRCQWVDHLHLSN
jgi:hypothetical protein